MVASGRGVYSYQNIFLFPSPSPIAVSIPLLYFLSKGRYKIVAPPTRFIQNSVLENIVKAKLGGYQEILLEFYQ